MGGMAIQVECLSWKVSVKAEKLIKVTYESMMKAIKIVKENVQLGDIGFAIQSM